MAFAAHEKPPTSLTPGYLPVAPFGHNRPTNIAELVLGSEPALRSPAGPASLHIDNDSLVLVRLHGEPVAVIYLEAGVAADSERVLEETWRQAQTSICRHMTDNGCGAIPCGPGDLVTGIGPACGCPSASPTADRPNVAVIIPTTRGGDTLARCLRSFDSLAHRELEILVVDNAPETNATRSVVESLALTLPRLRYVAEHRPGSSVARNRGIAETHSEFIAFTDDDVVIDDFWLPWLLSPFDDPAVKVVTGLVLPLELATPAQKMFELYAGFSKGIERRVYDDGANRDLDRVLYPYWGGVFGSGNSMAFRRGELVDHGGFDAALGAGSPALAGADIESFSRVIAGGGRLVYEPRSLCWHEHRSSLSALERQLFNYGAGLTAIFTKSILRDPRFLVSVVRSVPLVARHRRERPSRSEAIPTLPPHLARRQRLGMVQGPLFYARSVAWARRQRLGRVIRETHA